MQNRRHSPRKSLNTEVEYEAAGVRAKARLNNVGNLGVFIEGDSQLPVGAHLRLRFRLPEGEVVEVEGVVAHRQTGGGIGVAFISVGAEAAKRIREFVESGVA